jgi:GNAT superfamily N-acetyltransferase
VLEVRTATEADLPTLTTAWHEAAFWRLDERDERPAIDEALGIPDIRRYLWEPGRSGEVAVAAVADGEGIGGAWARLFPGDDPGYGFVDEETPELGIGVRDGWRGRGVGTALLATLLIEAAQAGHERLSLSVEVDNPSRHLYRKLGFRDVATADGATTMVRSTAATHLPLT